MDEETLEGMESALLEDPFDSARRIRYAAALGDSGRFADALKQFELVMKSDVTAGILVGAARCHLELDDREAALECYTRARRFEDFEPHEDLETLSRSAQPAERLRVVEGGKGDNVVEFRSATDRITFADVAGMDELKKTLRLQIIEPFRNPGLFQRFRKKAGGGVLLYGPPGCGKTLMARAIASECNASFLSVGISDVLNMWLGESERNLSLIFERARAEKPCVMFFDELDALAYSRSKSNSTSARTVVNEFLSQLDGFDFDNAEILILAATNMPWDVDPAMKRPGRFSRQVFVPPPDADARHAMLEMKLSGVPARDIDFAALAAVTRHFSGADIDGLIDMAKENALADILSSGAERDLRQADFAAVLDDITPSTIDWLKTARNLVKYAGADSSYKAVAKYLQQMKLG